MYCTYVEEADDAANKVSQRKRIGIIELFDNSACCAIDAQPLNKTSW